MMNKIISFLALVALTMSCVQIPDLDPTTNNGVDVIVNTYLDTILTNNDPALAFDGYKSVSYDLNGNGDIDFEFDPVQGFTGYFGSAIIIPNGSVFFQNLGSYRTPIYVNNLQGSNSFGSFAPINDPVFTTIDATIFMPMGQKYLTFKKVINNEDYYGWVEFFTYMNQGQRNTILSRAAIADESGVILRAGQTN